MTNILGFHNTIFRYASYIVLFTCSYIYIVSFVHMVIFTLYPLSTLLYLHCILCPHGYIYIVSFVHVIIFACIHCPSVYILMASLPTMFCLHVLHLHIYISFVHVVIFTWYPWSKWLYLHGILCSWRIFTCIL